MVAPVSAPARSARWPQHLRSSSSDRRHTLVVLAVIGLLPACYASVEQPSSSLASLQPQPLADDDTPTPPPEDVPQKREFLQQQQPPQPQRRKLQQPGSPLVKPQHGGGSGGGGGGGGGGGSGAVAALSTTRSMGKKPPQQQHGSDAEGATVAPAEAASGSADANADNRAAPAVPSAAADASDDPPPSAPAASSSKSKRYASPSGSALLSLNISTQIAPWTSDVLKAGLPVFVGSSSSTAGEVRWQQMMKWLPGFVSAVNGSLHRVLCDGLSQEKETESTQGVIDCHKRVALGALTYWGTTAGTYLDLEDNCYPSQRADYGLISDAVKTLLAKPGWWFIHLSRLPAPSGFISPAVSLDTPFHQLGGPILVKAVGTCEMAQAMLDHTDFARMITADDYEFGGAYDEQFNQQSVHVVYPAILQRRRQSELSGAPATPFFAQESWMHYLREIGFTPWVYTSVDFVNAHAGWATLCFLPVVVVACITNDVTIAIGTLISAMLLCWAVGVR